jgi:hypothetical protein
MQVVDESDGYTHQEAYRGVDILLMQRLQREIDPS